MRKRRLHDSKHPLCNYSFEALCCGSWQSVEYIKIRNGDISIHFADSHHGIEEKGPLSNLRLKSRPATSSDCTCFLRPGIDICALRFPQDAESSGEQNSEPEWVDAKISSIERKPHEEGCTCQFFINFYVNQGLLGSGQARVSKETEVLGLGHISILQKLDKRPSESQFYRWDSSLDCFSVPKTKLFLGKFSADLTWLLVASVQTHVSFDVRSFQNKLTYQISGCGSEHSSSKSKEEISFINFKVENGVLTPVLVHFVPPDVGEADPACEIHEPEPLDYDVMNLRRSKRRNVQPDRFLGCEITAELETGWVRVMPYTPEKHKKEEMSLPLPCLLAAQASCSQEQAEVETGGQSPEIELLEHERHSKVKTKPCEAKLDLAKQKEHQDCLAIVPMPTETNPLVCEKFDSSAKTAADELPVENCNTKGSAVTKIHQTTNGSSAKRVNHYTSNGSSTKKGHHSTHGSSDNNSYHSINGTPATRSNYIAAGSSSTKRQNNFDMEDLGGFQSNWGKHSTKKAQGARYHSIHSRRDNSGEPVTYKKTTLSAGAYNKLINCYMKNIDSTISSKEEPNIINQWEEFKANGRHRPDQSEEKEAPQFENDGECSETEMLWREMEICLASSMLLEEDEARVSTEAKEKLSHHGQHCQHEFKVDEEIGILCHICGFVETEIKYVSAPFMERTGWTSENKRCNEADSDIKVDEDEGLNISNNQTSCEEVPLSEESDNVWALIPDLRKKLHFHQKKAFEFLWENIAGSMFPARIEEAAKKIGGCVVSHNPGAGKTFLIIAFLVSYLKLFPARRPLVLAPKTTLYTWYKEFIKWEIPIPVHLIHGRRSYRISREKAVKFQGPKPSQDVMHVLDCLEKIQKWHAQPSVLVMGYTSFLTLMREDSKFAHRKHMAKVLRESPGLLILDEGHNPRSTKSRLRKGLMKVETDLRVLLSGTLFQNNFCEYFNTLCLARPKFIGEVLRELDPKFKRKKKGAEKARHLLEARARKFFIDTIAKKIDSSMADERMDGLNMLRKITNSFIDVYEGASSDTLPGLQIYTILMNSTDIQHEMLIKLRDIMMTYHGYPLELELLITLASIHPSLVKTSNCVGKFFDEKEQKELEKIKYDFRKGSKVMFVLNLVYRVVRKEKVLIFCHNIAPINLFVELFENVFGWERGREIMVLTGDLELFERGRVMDRFEEPGGPSKILLASITACAEGISLTAASRVILLDSEWNPSKTKQAIARAFRPGQEKVVYVYQLLATGTLEEDKHQRTTWKEWVSSMIFSEEFVEDPSCWQAEKIEDDVLRQMVGEDRVKSFHMIMKNEKASTG